MLKVRLGYIAKCTRPHMVTSATHIKGCNNSMVPPTLAYDENRHQWDAFQHSSVRSARMFGLQYLVQQAELDPQAWHNVLSLSISCCCLNLTSWLLTRMCTRPGKSCMISHRTQHSTSRQLSNWTAGCLGLGLFSTRCRPQTMSSLFTASYSGIFRSSWRKKIGQQTEMLRVKMKKFLSLIKS